MCKSFEDTVAELRADVTFECNQNAALRQLIVPEGIEPVFFRLITRGHELEPMSDHLTLAEAGFIDGQVGRCMLALHMCIFDCISRNLLLL